MANITELVGQILTKVVCRDGEEIKFHVPGGYYLMHHYQNCCESVGINDINGELEDLVGSTILVAEERTSNENPLDGYDESFTWTFYTLRTVKGSVDIRWYGSSNGYYSESVDFDFVAEQ